MSDEEQERRSFELRTKIEDQLGELAELWGPDDTIEFVESVLERMKEEAAEV